MACNQVKSYRYTCDECGKWVLQAAMEIPKFWSEVRGDSATALCLAQDACCVECESKIVKKMRCQSYANVRVVRVEHGAHEVKKDGGNDDKD